MGQLLLRPVNWMADYQNAQALCSPVPYMVTHERLFGTDLPECPIFLNANIAQSKPILGHVKSCKIIRTRTVTHIVTWQDVQE